MKKSILVAMFVLSLSVSACGNNNSDSKSNSAQSEKITYKDGTYNGESTKDERGNMIKFEIEVKDSAITNVKVQNLNGEGKEKDKDYGKDTNNEGLYKQAQNSLVGTATYGPKLIETQDIEKVDAVSGATMSNVAFKEAVKNALESAK